MPLPSFPPTRRKPCSFGSIPKPSQRCRGRKKNNCCVRWMRLYATLMPAKAFRLMTFASASAHGLQNDLFAASHCGSGNRRSFHCRDNPDAAARVGSALVDRVAILENSPLIGSLYSKRPSIRKLVSRPHIIYYRPRLDENCVDILRYWHAARSEPAL